ncbi:hypothetical protein [Elizabethkingia anophelis]|uniref:Uncharacterized protein n=2 Tax=Elizabethkingia anophelis TaxID=1117645 RepID=A0A455ZFK8_9FLAO|nr:hypothetical protein [Elizabethkingia anophelis]ATC35586.1 hypothetical protein BAZ09_004880 [Elizabethkingia anophelis R26]ATC39224.1 hypothetical protein EAAG1_004880 [Elizabethkingia anophelis Ag1]ATC42905.1 hypothetical protein CMV41_04880 [Elizabethkingia anophelis]ATC46581.1 hypothetical protein CMV40_04880 [Elizabethkingia anophelis]ELR81187.1 hypothetical protein D505_00515 [Elizabethkingia anophelis R26]
MTVKELLEKHPLLTIAELARLIYPENKSSRSKLTNKINENIVGTGKQRITDKDIDLIKMVLEKHTFDLKNDLKNLSTNSK